MNISVKDAMVFIDLPSQAYYQDRLNRLRDIFDEIEGEL